MSDNNNGKSNRAFRIDAIQWALTYSNVEAQLLCPPQSSAQYSGEQSRLEPTGHSMSLETFFDLLKQQLARLGRGYVYLAACRERHADGSTHFHAGVRLERKWALRDPRGFDVSGLHPNVQSARNFKKWIAYLKKDGDYVEDGDCDTIKEKTPRITPEELIEMAKTTDLAQFLAYCSVNKYFGGKDIWQMVHEDKSQTITDDTTIEGTINEQFAQLAKNFTWNTNLTLLVIGESGIGKTTWAKQTIPKPCLFVSHIDDLRKFKPDYHVSILFDDVSVNHMPETAQIHICDTENPRSIHCRYGTARIPAGTIKMFTCNTIPVDITSNAVSRRIQTLFAYQTDLDGVRP